MTMMTEGRRGQAVGVHSVNRFVFSVPVLSEAQVFYEAFGLDVRREADQLDLYTPGHAHCWACVYETGQAKRFEYLSLGLYAEHVERMRARIIELGIAAPPHPRSGGEGLWLRSPDGMLIQLQASPKVMPDAKSPPAARLPAAPGQRAAPCRSAVAQVRPRRLSHVLIFSPDVLGMVRFCEDVLGLRLSDRSGDGVAFLHGVHGSDHHLVAFAKSSHAGLHHSSWDVGSIDEVGMGAEQMRQAGYDRGWGVGRHVLGSNYFHYVRDPWGSYAEYSFDIDYIPHDTVWPSADHPAHDALHVWGPSVPDEFFINHEQSPT